MRNAVAIYALILMSIFGLMMLAPRVFINIPAGHVGVLWLRFLGGTVTERSFSEGVQVIFPWDEMFIYDARLQNSSRVYDTISSNGLGMEVDIAVRYRINSNTVGQLHKLVGPDYPEVLVYPEIGSQARELIAHYSPEQLYTGSRAFIQAQILERMVTQLGSSLVNQSFGGKLVDVEDVLIRSVTLPKGVADAIERKAEQYHVMLEYDFRIEREKKERERKRIEAEGVREFQDIVSHTITDEYLRLRGIEATMALATSNNSKMIIMGGRDGLPVILNTDSTSAAPAMPAGGLPPALTSRPDVGPPNAAKQDIAAPNSILPNHAEPQVAPAQAGSFWSPAWQSSPLTPRPTVPTTPDPRGSLDTTGTVRTPEGGLAGDAGSPAVRRPE